MTQILLKTETEIEAMRAGGRILAQVLQVVGQAVGPGITPVELSNLAGREVKALGATAAFLGHQGFPAPICISVNEVVVHGIPVKEPLQSGDIIGLDFGVRYQGLVTDGAVTLPVGTVNAEANHLLSVTESARRAGIFAARAGNRIGDISAAVQAELQRGRLSIIEELVGHGVGRQLWEEPQVPNYGRPHTGPILQKGMTIAIEPMATLGRKQIEIDAEDGWTVRTSDGSLAAQFEHTILITDGEPEILTALDD
jgi:methionyl aminopeptidase